MVAKENLYIICYGATAEVCDGETAKDGFELLKNALIKQNLKLEAIFVLMELTQIRTTKEESNSADL